MLEWVHWFNHHRQLGRSGTSRQRKPKRFIIGNRPRCPRQRDSNQTASGKLGAVQGRQPRRFGEWRVSDMRQTDTRYRLRLFAVIAVLAGLPCPALSEVSYTPKSGNSGAHISISGQIQPDDLKHFIAFAKMARTEGLHHPLYQVILNSLGGDVETALAIGRIMRLDKAAVAVLREGKCLSSCIFVLAGGTIRYVDGPVGIHRPFVAADTRTTAHLQKKNYERIETEVKAFLRDVNIPAELYDHMLRVPPDKVKFLSKDELQRYGLSEDDPYEDAARIAEVAAILGITAEELIRRQATANAKCSSDNIDDNARCLMRILEEGK